MAKIKRKIQKIVWDTERGYGVAKEHIATAFSFGQEEENEDTKNFFTSPNVALLKEREDETRSFRDPEKPSPHLLDLRHVRRAQSAMAPPSFFSRLLSYRRKKKEKQSRNAPLLSQGNTQRFPSIDADALVRHFAKQSFPAEQFFATFAPAYLLERFPLLAQLSIGVLVMITAHAIIFLSPFCIGALHILGSVSRYLATPFRQLRFFMSTMRYGARRLRIEWEGIFPSSQSAEVSLLLPPIHFSFRRVIVVFVGIAMVVTLPFYALSSYASILDINKAKERGSELFAYIDAGTRALGTGDWKAARDAWVTVDRESARLGSDFYLTNSIVGLLGSFFSSHIRTGRAALSATSALAEGGIAASSLGELLQNGDPLTDRLLRMQAPFADLVRSTDRIAEATSRIDTSLLPAQFLEQYERLAPFAGNFQSMVHRVQNFLAIAPKLLGHDRGVRYLALFQNENEARPTGGFIGSMAVVDIDAGSVRKIFMPSGGSYDLQGALRLNYRAPEPLQYINPRFEFQDANWWPDFPTSAKKILSFWEKSGGPTVDGVIAVNAGLFEKFLPILGSIDMPEYGKRIDQKNFFFETEKAVELEYDRVKNTPKKFLRDLASAVLARFGTMERKDVVPVALLFLNALSEKDLQVYLRDPVAEERVVREGIGGAFSRYDREDDSLRLVRTNIGGAKTDRVLRDAIVHETTIEDSGALVDRVTITRMHGGKKGDLFVGARSRDYLRVYVPEGSVLLDANGFSLPTRRREIPSDAYQNDPDLSYLDNRRVDPEKRVETAVENARTFFGGWVELDPGEVKTISLSYRLPFSLSAGRLSTYRLHLEKQSGMPGTTITHRTILPATFSLEQQSGMPLSSPVPWIRDMTLLQTLTRQ